MSVDSTGLKAVRIDDFDLSSERIGKFLELGLRPVKLKEPRRENLVAVFMLIPTKTFKFEELYESEWEGSYVPWLVYKQARAAILVPYGEERKWLRLANHISAITLIPTEVRPD